MHEDKFQAIKNAALSGNMITAIKLYREAYGVGLAEAKHAVEELVRAWVNGETPPLPSPVLSTTTPPPTPSSSGLPAQLRSLVLGGQKIAAIKLYREHHHVGLAEAKAAIDSLEAELRLQSPAEFTAPPNAGATGCVVLLILLGVVGYGVWLFLH